MNTTQLNPVIDVTELVSKTLDLLIDSHHDDIQTAWNAESQIYDNLPLMTEAESESYKMLADEIKAYFHSEADALPKYKKY